MTTTSSTVSVAAPALGGAGAATEQRAASDRAHAALEKAANPDRVNHVVAIAGIVAWIVFALVTWLLPDNVDLPLADAGTIAPMTPFTVVVGFVAAAVGLAAWLATRLGGHVGAGAVHRVAHAAPWFLAAAIWALFWEFSTAKAAFLAPPYFVAPQQIFDSFVTDRGILAQSLGNSLLLLLVGLVVGLVAGLITGVVIGWYQVANYWVHPILVLIGPVPALTWVPIAFVLLPSTYSGAVFIIALSVWFPITILTRAGILSVPRAYFDVAQTLGARGWFLVLRVSVPAALPSIFTGAFMALGASFVSLTVAENFGVNAGLGWFINWKKGWGDFPGLYAGIVLLVLVCSVALTLLFRVRNYVLRWEKELTRW